MRLWLPLLPHFYPERRFRGSAAARHLVGMQRANARRTTLLADDLIFHYRVSSLPGVSYDRLEVMDHGAGGNGIGPRCTDTRIYHRCENIRKNSSLSGARPPLAVRSKKLPPNSLE